jgi:hypothetical protein
MFNTAGTVLGFVDEFIKVYFLRAIDGALIKAYLIGTGNLNYWNRQFLLSSDSMPIAYLATSKADSFGSIVLNFAMETTSSTAAWGIMSRT